MDSEGDILRPPDDEPGHSESTTIPPPSDLDGGPAADPFAAGDTLTASDDFGAAGSSAVLFDARAIARRTTPLERGADSPEAAESAGFSLDTDVDIEAEAEVVAEAPGAPPAELARTVRFKVQDRLGAGGMGVVYRAHDRERGEFVAVKTMRRIDPKTLYRFKHEFRSLADLSHPNLVNLYELVASGGHWFFTMELVEGVDFITYIRAPSASAAQAAGADPAAETPASTSPGSGSGSGSALEPDQIGRLRQALRQLAAGIAALHEAGKLHRDIKPTNVLVTAEGRVVVLDFGLVADLGPSGQLESDGEAVVGTVAYMAPEQSTVQPVGRSCDWYSVGVMLFVALTGRLPFEGRPGTVLVQKRTCEAPCPSAFASGIPADLDALCADLLRRDPAARPSDQEVLARLAAPVVASVPAAGGQGVPLIGRERHLEVLRSAFVSVRGGRPEVVLVSGRSGSGKSTLIQTFLDDLTAGAEAVVLSGRCYERESVPYKALDSVVDALSRYLKPLAEAVVQPLLPRDVAHLARVFPVLNRVDAVALAPRPEFEIPDQQELRRRAFAALRTLLANIGREKPLVVAIDDLQWADPENAPLVAELVYPPDAPRMLLLGSFRTEDVETSAFLRALLGTDADDSSRLTLKFQELSVGALSQGDARALALALLGRDDAITRAEAHLVARESHGNPFFLDELVKHIQGGGGFAHRSVAAGAITLDEVLWARVGRLTDDARRLLGIVAVSARPIDLRVAFQAAGFTGGSAGRAAVGLLRTSRLIRAAGPTRRDAIEVYHDHIRETVLAQLPGDQLQEYHLRLAETLEVTAGTDPESLAIQFQGAARFAKAEHYFGLAADRAAGSLAFDHAARLYRRALELGGAGGRDRALLNRKLGDALANAGRGGEAARAYLAATAGASVAGTLELKRRDDATDHQRPG